MLQFSGVLLRISTFIFILSSVTITKGNIIRVSAMAGEEIQFSFSYPCNSSKVTLGYQANAPFWDSDTPKSNSLPKNQGIEVHNDTTRDNCFIKMLLTNPLMSDIGLYNFLAYAGDGKLLKVTRVGLRVDYPPGKASCEWGPENFSSDRRFLNCTAQPGSLVGEIICYQNGIWVPPKQLPRDGVNSLKEIIRMRYSQPAFCCAVVVTVGQFVDRCKCMDYKWDPNNNHAEPCPVAMVTAHQEVSTSSYSPTSIPTKEATQKAKKNHWSNDKLHVIYMCVIAILVIIIICLCIALRASNRKANRVKKYGRATYSQPHHVHVNTDGKGEKII